MLGKRHAQQINRRYFWKTKGQITKAIGNFWEIKRHFWNIKEHFWKAKGKFQEKKVLLENKRAILGIERHFWEAKGHIDLRTRTLATLQTPPLKWSFLDISSQNKISNIFLETVFSHGSADQLSWSLNSLKCPLNDINWMGLSSIKWSMNPVQGWFWYQGIEGVIPLRALWGVLIRPRESTKSSN